MNLAKTSWHARLFFWSLGIWDEFTGWDTEWQFRDGTNLCHYVRVICLYLPLVFLVHLSLLLGAVSAVTALPFYLFGMGYVATAVGIALAVLTIFGLVKGVDKLVEKFHTVAMEAEKRPKVDKGPGFFKVLWTWLVAQKKRVCPGVTFYIPQEVKSNA